MLDVQVTPYELGMRNQTNESNNSQEKAQTIFKAITDYPEDQYFQFSKPIQNLVDQEDIIVE